MNDASAARRRKMLTLVGIYLALVVNLMTSTTNATVFPAAAADIGGMDIYGLAQGVSGILSVCIMPIYGALGACRPALERILCGGSLMVGAAVLFVRGIAPSMIWIIASNVLWGLVSAGVFVLGFSMIRDMYDKVQAGVYLGMVGTMQSLGMLAGPFIGGLVIDHIGWRVFCFLLFALLALAGMFVLLGQRSFGEVPDSVNGKLGIDKLGAFAMVVFLGCFIIAVSMGMTWIPFGSIASTVLFVVAAVGLVVLVIDLRRKGSSAIVPLDALKDRNVMVFSCLNFFYNFGAMSLTFFVPGFVMTSMTGDSLVGFLGAALAGGLVLTIRAIPGLFLGPIFGKAIAKSGSARGVLHLGNVLRIITVAGLIFALAHGVPVWIVYLLMMLAGVFTSQHSVTMSAGPQIQLSESLRTTGNSVIQLFQNFGGSIGTAVFTLVMSIGAAAGMQVCLVLTFISWVLMAVVTPFLKKGQVG